MNDLDYLYKAEGGPLIKSIDDRAIDLCVERHGYGRRVKDGGRPTVCWDCQVDAEKEVTR